MSEALSSSPGAFPSARPRVIRAIPYQQASSIARYSAWTVQYTAHRPVLQIARSVLLLGSTWFNFLALRYLQLDEVMAIAFATPFIVAL